MHLLYGLHTIAWASMGTLAVIALIVNYIKRDDERRLPGSNRTYMIRNVLGGGAVWLVTGPLWLLLLPGWIA